MNTDIDKEKEMYDEFWESAIEYRSTGPGNRWAIGLINKALSFTSKEAVNNILDVGCGEGSKTCLLKSYFSDASVIGIDFSSSAIEAAKQYACTNSTDVEFRCINAKDVSVYDNKFDLIACFDTLEHIEDWKALVDRFISSSKKYILLSFPTGRMRNYERLTGHLRNFQKNEVESYLAKYDFVPVKVYYAGFPFYNPIGRNIISLVYGFYYSKIISSKQPTLITNIFSSLVYFLLNYCSTKEHLGNHFVGLFEYRK